MGVERAIPEQSTCKMILLALLAITRLLTMQFQISPSAQPHPEANLQLRLSKLRPYLCQARSMQQASGSAHGEGLSVAQEGFYVGSWLTYHRSWRVILT